MILSGVKKDSSELSKMSSNDQAYLNAQSGTTLLDKFTHCLLFKCYCDALDILNVTLVTELKRPNKTADESNEAQFVARRFIRSVARIYVILTIELAPNIMKRKILSNHLPINKCKKVFNSMVRLSVEELCEVADSLISPVRLGNFIEQIIQI